MYIIFIYTSTVFRKCNNKKVNVFNCFPKYINLENTNIFCNFSSKSAIKKKTYSDYFHYLRRYHNEFIFVGHCVFTI